MNMFSDGAKKRAEEVSKRQAADQLKQAERGQYARAVATDLNAYINDEALQYAGKFEITTDENVVSVSHKASGDTFKITAVDRGVFEVKCDQASYPSGLGKDDMVRAALDWLAGDAGR